MHFQNIKQTEAIGLQYTEQYAQATQEDLLLHVCIVATSNAHSHPAIFIWPAHDPFQAEGEGEAAQAGVLSCRGWPPTPGAPCLFRPSP